MENLHSKLFQSTFKKVIKKKGSELKNFLINQKKKHKAFNKVHNQIVENLETEFKEHYYINHSGLFNQLLTDYTKRYDEYEEEYVNLIFDDLYDSFKLIKEVKKGYSYKEFVKELALIEAIKEAYRLFRNLNRITELMYDNDQLDKFRLRKVSLFVDTDVMFKEQRFIKLNRENPNRYKDYLDYSKQEEELFIKTNPFIKKQNIDKVNVEENNFKVKERFKENIEKLYLSLTDVYINEDLTTFEDFTNVFFENWKTHNSKIYFICSSEEASYFLFRLKFIFQNLSFASIHRSELFYTSKGNLFKEDNLSKQKRNIIEEEKDDIEGLLNKVGLILPD